MSIKSFISSALLVPLLYSCTPKPLDIEIPQEPGNLTISSVALGAQSVFVTAGYSVETGFNLADTSEQNRAKMPGMVVDSGLVTITELGQLPDTLRMYGAGVFGRTNLRLKPGAQYTLTVRDFKKGTAATATTTYLPAPSIERLQPEVIREGNVPTVKLHIKLNDVQPGERFFIGYSTKTNIMSSLTPLIAGMGSLQSFETKQIELINGSKAVNGVLEHSFTVEAIEIDTLTVQLGRIDEKYYKYLEAYKRTGYLLNQVSGEPINLPSNVKPGFGFFSLYAPHRARFPLLEY